MNKAHTIAQPTIKPYLLGPKMLAKLASFHEASHQQEDPTPKRAKVTPAQQTDTQPQAVQPGGAGRVDEDQVLGDAAAGSSFDEPVGAIHTTTTTPTQPNITNSNPHLQWVQSGEPRNKLEPGLTPQEPESPSSANRQSNQHSNLPWDHPTNFPVARHTGRAQMLFDVEPADLPICLRYGLPPEMTNQLSGTF